MAETVARLLAALAAAAVLAGLWLFAHGLYARLQARRYKRLVEQKGRTSGKRPSNPSLPHPSTGKPGAISQPAATSGDLQCPQEALRSSLRRS